MKNQIKANIIKVQGVIMKLHKVIFKAHYKKIMNLIEPNLFGVKKEKFGKVGDGTYILPIDLIPDDHMYKLLSFGISDDISFENDFCEKFKNIDVYAFDPTINELPDKHEKIRFLKLGLVGKNGRNRNMLTFNEIIQKLNLNNSNKYILKIDIEGHEWGFLSSRDFDLFDIPIITIELHFMPYPLETVSIPFAFFKKYAILKRVLDRYYIHHVHANNAKYLKFDEFYFPVLLELTLIKKSIFKQEILNDIESLNKPNKPNKADFQYPFKVQ